MMLDGETLNALYQISPLLTALETMHEALEWYADKENWKNENVDTEDESFSFAWIQDDNVPAKVALDTVSSLFPPSK